MLTSKAFKHILLHIFLDPIGVENEDFRVSCEQKLTKDTNYEYTDLKNQ